MPACRELYAHHFVRPLDMTSACMASQGDSHLTQPSLGDRVRGEVDGCFRGTNWINVLIIISALNEHDSWY